MRILPPVILRSYVLLFSTLWIVFFVLLPSSVYTYYRFANSVLPQGPIIIPLDFQFSTSKSHSGGSYASLGIHDHYDTQLSTMWKKLTTNRFTKLTHTLMINLEYINLNPSPIIGNMRTSIASKPHPMSSYDPKTNWPFIEICPVMHQQTEEVIQFKEIVNKSIITSNIFLSKPVEDHNMNNMLDFLMPKWIQRIFVPSGWVSLMKFQTLETLLSRDKSKLFKQYTGPLPSLPYKPYILSSELTKLDSKSLLGGALKDKFILVELDHYDVFITRASLSLEWGFTGLRYWIYWLPGFCFLIGVGFLWTISSFICGLMSFIGYGMVEFRNASSQTEEDDDEDKIILKNLEDLEVDTKFQRIY